MTNAIVFSGPQGAGKSTFYHQHFHSSHIRLNLDMLRTRNREQILLHACLAAQQPFVVDNTNPTRAQRAKYLALARAAGFKVDLYYFDIPMEDALTRNRRREGRQRVPDIAVKGTIAKKEPPELAAGWTQVYVVTVTNDVFAAERVHP